MTAFLGKKGLAKKARTPN